MKQYKVIALSVGGKSNKVFDSGDTVNEDAFEEGHAEVLVEKGFLSPIEDGVTKTSEELSQKPKSAKQAKKNNNELNRESTQ